MNCYNDRGTRQLVFQGCTHIGHSSYLYLVAGYAFLTINVEKSSDIKCDIK